MCCLSSYAQSLDRTKIRSDIESSNVQLIIQPLPLNIFSITCDISQNLSSCTPNQMCDSLILFHPSDVIRKAYEQKGTLLKKGFCFMNLISLRTFKKKH